MQAPASSRQLEITLPFVTQPILFPPLVGILPAEFVFRALQTIAGPATFDAGAVREMCGDEEVGSRDASAVQLELTSDAFMQRGMLDASQHPPVQRHPG